MKHLVLAFFLFVSIISGAQESKDILFIGNSYTYSNDLPNMLKSIANEDNISIFHQSSTPGGYTFQQHSQNANTLSLISSKVWDVVVLQEQSQLPSFPDEQVESMVYPYASILVDSIYSTNPCAVPLFFNTWGRRDGDSQWEGINTFEKMNNRLFHAYSHMAEEAQGMLAPVGVAFHAVKLESEEATVTFNDLYVSDGSHPSTKGTYLAACVFNNVINNTTSIGNSFIPAGMTVEEVSFLQAIADHVVYEVDSVIIDFRPMTGNDFSYSITSNEVSFYPELADGELVRWMFGDGEESNEENPVHEYISDGFYEVKMIVANGCYSDTVNKTIEIITLGLDSSITPEVKITPNPSLNGQIKIDYDGKKDYLIFDSQGEKIYQGKNNLLNLPQGMYFFHYQNLKIKFIIL